MNTESIPDAVLDDLAERIGRIATKDMLTMASSERRNLAIAGDHTAFLVLDAVRDHFDPDDVDAFVDRLRTSVALHEETAA